MAIYEIDSRQSEADRMYDRLVAQGYAPAAVARLIPALVGPEEARESAERWLSQNAHTGLGDLGDKSQAEQRHLAYRASVYLDGMLEEGVFTGAPLYQPGDRYEASDEALTEVLDREHPNSGMSETYAEQHARLMNAEQHARQTTDTARDAGRGDREPASAYGTGVNRPFFED